MMRAFVMVAAAIVVAAFSSSYAVSATIIPSGDKIKAQYGYIPALSNGDADVDQLLHNLNLSNANNFNVLLEGSDGQPYLQFVQLLFQLTKRNIGSKNVSIFVTLIPPSETRDGFCSIVADSPLTPFNETSFFNMSLGPHGCNDYQAWSMVMQLLRTTCGFANLFAMNIDDFSDDLGTFNKNYVDEMHDRLNNSVLLIPTIYYGNGTEMFVLDRNPWLRTSLDGFLFYFRNERAGYQTCSVKNATCAGGVTPPSDCPIDCLWGSCSEVSMSNLGVELNDFFVALENYQSLDNFFVGVYFSPYSSCSPGPSTLYDFVVLASALRNPHVRGTMVYRTQVTANCTAGMELVDKGCAVKYVYTDGL